MRTIPITLSVLLTISCFAQKQTFDIITYAPPKGWAMENSESAIQFTKKDDTKGTFCIITLMKSLPGGVDSKGNFDAAWETVVKEMVKVSAAPEMQPVVNEDGWEVQSGYAPFQTDELTGVALLVTSTGHNKMVNILILTNTDAYEEDMTAFLESAEFQKTTQIIPAAKQDGFAFTTTNFDDGWVSTVQEDWVEVARGNIKVLLHYPKQGTLFAADPEPLINAAWNILVAPRYNNLQNYRTTSITTYSRPYLGFGNATDNKTGNNVYIVLFRQGQAGWYEFITPDKNTFIQQYKFDPETILWDSESDLMNPLIQMGNYNKFAVAASDFNGTWTSNFSGMQQLYNVYTGDYAGSTVSQSNEEFVFGAGGSYNWKLLAVNGMVGNMRYNQVKSAGRLTVLNNWQVSCSDIEGKPKKFDAFFSCIKGARVLHLRNADYPGVGYTSYGLKK